MNVLWKYAAATVLLFAFLFRYVSHKEQTASASFQLKCQETVRGEINSTVILPCITDPKTNIKASRVEWMTNKIEVHVYRKGEDELKHQGKDYKGRTSVFHQELSNGNCSLKLKVLSTYAGTYVCNVKIGEEEVSCSLNLTVQGQATTISSDKVRENPMTSPTLKNDNTHKITISTSVVVVVVIVAVVSGLVCC